MKKFIGDQPEILKLKKKRIKKPKENLLKKAKLKKKKLLI